VRNIEWRSIKSDIKELIECMFIILNYIQFKIRLEETEIIEE
jgi:hypothetical protein